MIEEHEKVWKHILFNKSTPFYKEEEKFRGTCTKLAVECNEFYDWRWAVLTFTKNEETTIIDKEFMGKEF
jgi:hypothetical protein